MATEGLGPLMTPAVILLSAAVVAVPLFRRLGLGSVLGYFAAGLAVGPFGFGFFSDPEAMLTVSELGVVLFLFIIGLEMRPARLWTMRRQIFGIGLFQVLTCVALLTGTAMLFGHGPRADHHHLRAATHRPSPRRRATRAPRAASDAAADAP